MQFNPASDAQSIVARINRACGSDNNTYPLLQKANDCNEGLDRYWYLAFMADGKWQIDDTNNTDLPVATANLVSGQIDYQLPATAMIIDKILVSDSAGNWTELEEVDIQDDTAKHIWELTPGNSGIPNRYELMGNSVFLDPIPNYSKASAIKIVFQRGPSYFVYNDTTKTPGIPAIFHSYVVHYASMIFCSDKNLPKKQDQMALVGRDEEAIGDFYSHRNTDEKQVIRPKYVSPL